jgi:alpha-N-arabinofuranosidase
VDPNNPATVRTSIEGMKASGVSGRVLTAAALNAHNTFDNPGAVRPAAFNGATLEGAGLKVDLPAKSVVVLEVK